jgi:hypothetical protein
MSLNRFGKLTLAALVALAFGFLSPLARAGDDGIAQQSCTKGKCDLTSKQSYKAPYNAPQVSKQSVQQQSFKGKNDPTPDPKGGTASNNKSGNVQKTGVSNNKVGNTMKTTTASNNKVVNTVKTGAPSNNKVVNTQ